VNFAADRKKGNMISFTLAFLGYAFAVSLKSWQQLNVVNRKRVAIPIVSIAMAGSEVLIVSRIIVDGWSAVIPMGLGGGLGCLLTLKLFDKFNKHDNTNRRQDEKNNQD
jgi:hypothetical protein